MTSELQNLRRQLWSYLQPHVRNFYPSLDEDIERLGRAVVDLSSVAVLLNEVEDIARYGVLADGQEGESRSELARYLLFFYVGLKAGMLLREKDHGSKL